MRTLLPILATTALALTACNKSADEAQGEAQATAAAQANGLQAATELPPGIEATVTFRCQPGDVLETVNFYAGNKQVGLKEAGSPLITMLTRTEEQGPYTLAPSASGTAPAADAAPAAETTGTTFTGDRTTAVLMKDGQTLQCKT